MSIRAYRCAVATLACAVLFLGWRYFTLSGEMATAAFISFQCETTEKNAKDISDPAVLANDLEFLIGYYQGESKALIGSPIYRVVQRDYQHAVSNSLNAFRRIVTNDLGDDPGAWIKMYAH